MKFNRILLPLDGSELAETALALAEALSAVIVLLRVVVRLSIKLDPDLYQHIIDSGQNQTKVYLNSIESRSLFSQIRLRAKLMWEKRPSFGVSMFKAT